MNFLLAYIVMIFIGGITMWIVAKLFSGDPPELISCFLGAGIAEFFSLFNIPFLPSIVLFIVLVKVARFEWSPAFFATIIYGILKKFLFMTIVSIFVRILG